MGDEAHVERERKVDAGASHHHHGFHREAGYVHGICDRVRRGEEGDGSFVNRDRGEEVKDYRAKCRASDAPKERRDRCDLGEARGGNPGEKNSGDLGEENGGDLKDKSCGDVGKGSGGGCRFQGLRHLAESAGLIRGNNWHENCVVNDVHGCLGRICSGMNRYDVLCRAESGLAWMRKGRSCPVMTADGCTRRPVCILRMHALT